MFDTSCTAEKWNAAVRVEIGGARSDKMRALHVICLAAVFHAIFVATRANEDHEIQNSTTTRDVKCKAACTSLHDQVLMTPILPDGEDYKTERSIYTSRMKHRTTHRPRTKPNTKLRNLSDKGFRPQVNHVPPVVRISNETDLHVKNYENINVHLRNQKSKNYDEGDTHIYPESLDDHYPFHGGLESLLARLMEALENNSKKDDHGVSNSSAIDDEDRCQRWLDNREKIETAFPGSIANLPTCPCLYPNGIFYNNQIWDKKRERNFRWRDVSHDQDRLAIYKPGAAYCVQTLPSQESESAIAQHCCYDEDRKLLTRGSGAGTPYIVSPDISPLLHDKIDLLPWRLCKGDFTRYNEVRIPNNGNNCKTNPNDEEYQRQVENAKNY